MSLCINPWPSLFCKHQSSCQGNIICRCGDKQKESFHKLMHCLTLTSMMAQSEKNGFKTVSLGQRKSLCYFSLLINVSFWGIIFSEPYRAGRLIGFQFWVLLHRSVSSRPKVFLTSEISLCCGKSRKMLLKTCQMSMARLSVTELQSDSYAK